MDHLGLKQNKQVLKLLNKYVNNHRTETIQYSVQLMKINKREKFQTRILLLTNKGVYNIKPKNYALKRRIDIHKIGSMAMSLNSSQFTICVPCEYDYRYKANNVKQQNEIIDTISNLYAKIKKKELIIHKISATSTIAYTINKDVARLRAQITQQNAISTCVYNTLKTKLTNNMSTKLCAELTVYGYIHSEIEQQIMNVFIPQDIIIFITMYYFNKVSMQDFIFHDHCIGIGSFSLIYKVHHKNWNVTQTNNINIETKYFAMQIYSKDKLKKRDAIHYVIESRKMFEKIGSFVIHPYIKQLHYAFQTKSKLVLVYDYFYGGQLWECLRKNRRFPEATVQIWIAEISLAVGYLHRNEIFDICIKPENILLCMNGHCHLSHIDFTPNEHRGSIQQSPEYLSPEILNGKQVDKNIDWWTIGVLLYELVVGIPPFYSQNINQMYRKIQDGPLLFPPNVSNKAKDLITRLLQRDVRKRLGFVNDVLDIITDAFFEDLNWEKLKRKEIKSLYIPTEEVKLKRNDYGYHDVIDTDEELCYEDECFGEFTCFPN
eukprot:189600_1